MDLKLVISVANVLFDQLIIGDCIKDVIRSSDMEKFPWEDNCPGEAIIQHALGIFSIRITISMSQFIIHKLHSCHW